MRNYRYLTFLAPIALGLTVHSSLAAQSKAPAKPKGQPTIGQGITFEGHIKPILTEYCMGCHNKNTLAAPLISGGLALDTYEAVKAGATVNGKKSTVLDLAHVDKSSLYARLVTPEAARRMPKGSDPLSPAQAELFRKWIAAGAPKGTSVTVKVAPSSSAAMKPVPVTLPTKLVPPTGVAPASAPKDAKLDLIVTAGPFAPVTALAYSPDGKVLALGLYKAVQFWDTSTGKPSTTIAGLEGQALSIVWSQDGNVLAVSGGSPGVRGEVKLYDVTKQYSLIGTLDGHTDVVYSVSFSADGKTIATASHDKTVKTWNRADRKPLLTLKNHSDAVYQVRFMPDSQSLVSVGADRAVRRAETATGKSVRNYEGHGASVNALAIRPDGAYVVTSGQEPRVRWWNAGNGNTDRYSDGHGQPVTDIVFSKDGKLLAAVGADKSVRVWDGNNGGQLKTFTDTPDWNYAVAISPDNKVVAAAGADGFVRLWGFDKGQYLGALALIPGNSGVEWFAYTPSGFFAASDALAKRVTIGLAGVTLKAGSAWIPTLNQMELVTKSLLGTPPVEGPKLAAAAPTTTPAKQ